jgi:hypothetical protein
VSQARLTPSSLFELRVEDDFDQVGATVSAASEVGERWRKENTRPVREKEVGRVDGSAEWMAHVGEGVAIGRWVEGKGTARV